MKSIIIAVITFAVLAVAVQPPVISDNFYAKALVEERLRDGRNIRFDGELYSAYSLLMERINVDSVHEKPVHFEFLRDYNNNTEYEITSQGCQEREFNTTFYNPFSWVQHEAALAKHECHSPNHGDPIGQLWLRQDSNFIRALCVNSQNTTSPYYLQFASAQHNEYRKISFFYFNPEMPDKSNFVIPSNC